MPPLTLSDVGVVAQLITTLGGLGAFGYAIAKGWVRLETAIKNFEHRFDLQDEAIERMNGTMANAMKRIGEAETGLGIVMDRTSRTRTGGAGG